MRLALICAVVLVAESNGSVLMPDLPAPTLTEPLHREDAIFVTIDPSAPHAAFG